MRKEGGCYNQRSIMGKTASETTAVAPEVLAKYEPVIGLEVHVQLLTKTKIFCGCSTRFGDPPNTNVCPVCLGLPGALPVLNKRALEMAVRAALALHCTVREHSRFARKNYFYPDLPKGYQISMYELPLATEGWLEIDVDGLRKRVGITRLHMEDDAAKALHELPPNAAPMNRVDTVWTYVDFNRGGTPLIEIVSEPDIRTPEEAYAYLTTLKQVMLYTETSDCNMEEGSLRCDANVSVRPRGSAQLGTKVEVKNLNSFRYLQRALEYEIERHVAALESGGKLAQETRLWNQAAGRTESMRTKERAHDYRYFPEPDLLPVHVSAEWREAIRATMPELPDAKRARFIEQYGITPYDAGVLTATRESADYFEAVVKAGAEPQMTSNWMARLSHLANKTADLMERVTEKSGTVEAQRLAELIHLVATGRITAASASQVLAKMLESGQTAAEIVASEGLTQISDTTAIERAAREVIEKNPENVAKYRAGNEGVFKFFVGQVMRATRGQANPRVVNEVLQRLLAGPE